MVTSTSGSAANDDLSPNMIKNGPGRGVCANFLSLANDPTIDADYFAFSDQDDIWNQEKLRCALAWLASVPTDVPGMVDDPILRHAGDVEA